MTVGGQTAIPSYIESAKIEFGGGETTDHNSNPSSLIVASYNIRYAVGQFLISTGLLRKVGFNLPRNRSEVVTQNILLAARAFSEGLRLPPVQLLALQEADIETARCGGHHITRELAKLLQMSWVHVSAGIPRGIEPKKRQWWLNFEEQIGLHDSGDTGVSLLSRLPIEDVTRIDLPWHECPWRPRLSMGATIKVGAEAFRVFNSHIDPHSSPGGQIEQLEIVLDQADKFDGPSIVLGDFNTLSRRKCIESRRLLETRGYTTPFPTGTPTWRGAGLLMHADWIFVRDLRIRRSGIARGITVSDHWPVWVEIGVPLRG